MNIINIFDYLIINRSKWRFPFQTNNYSISHSFNQPSHKSINQDHEVINASSLCKKMKEQLKSKTLETKIESTITHFLNTPINTLIQNKTHFAKSQVKQVLSTLQLTTIFRNTTQKPKVKSLTFKSSSRTESNSI